MDGWTYLVIILAVLVLSDIFWKWSNSAAAVAGASLLKALLERALQIFLPLIGFLVPLFILVFGSLRDRLGPHLTDHAVRKLGLFQLLAAGIVLGALLGMWLSLWGNVDLTAEGGAASMFLVRTTVWLLAWYVFFLGYLILWLWRMLRLLNTESAFSFLVPFVTRGFNAWCQNQERAMIAVSEIDAFYQSIGVKMIPFSSLGNPIVIAHRSGQLKDVRLWRLGNTVRQLLPDKRNQLIITAWPFHYTERGSPLVQAKKGFDLDEHSANRLRQCFVLSRRVLRTTRLSGPVVFDLLTEQARVSAKSQDRCAFQKWLDAFIPLMKIAKKHELGSLPDFAGRALSHLVEEVSKSGDKVIVSTLSYWLYRQALATSHQGDNFGFEGYLHLLQWQFRCSLFANNKFGADRAVYYLLSLGQDHVRALERVSSEEQLQNCLQQLNMFLGIMRELLGYTLENGDTGLVRKLCNETNELIDIAMYALTTQYSRRELFDAIDAASSELTAYLQAIKYYIGAWALENYFDGRIGSELARASLELATDSFNSPDVLVGSLEQIHKHKLWVKREAFEKQNLLSPLPKTRWGDVRSPFLRFYIVGGLKLAWNPETWPSRSSPVIREFLPTIEALCEEIKASQGQWREVVPLVTTENINGFLEIQRRMAERARKEEQQRIEKAELVEDTVQRFAEQCVTSFRESSVLLNLFIELNPDYLQKSSELGLGKEVTLWEPKEPFTRFEEPPISGAGEAWAEWNDRLCLQSISPKLSEPIEDVEVVAAQMRDASTPPQTVLASPMMRKCYTSLSGFRPATAEERNRFQERLNLAGWWMGIPVFRTHLVPRHEIWLMNLSGATRLIEYLNAKVRVEPLPDRPLQVLLKFPQRIQVVVDNSSGLRRLTNNGPGSQPQDQV